MTTITTTQKIIKIGDSAGVTIPAKELKRAGIKPGDEIKFSFEPVVPVQDDVLNDYAVFKAQYGDTLKNLANRDATDAEVLGIARELIGRYKQAFQNLADR